MIQRLDWKGRRIAIKVRMGIGDGDKAHKVVSSVDDVFFRDVHAGDKNLIAVVKVLMEDTKKFIDDGLSTPLMRKLSEMGFEHE